jgi:Domain of unknown function (DUF4190)
MSDLPPPPPPGGEFTPSPPSPPPAGGGHVPPPPPPPPPPGGGGFTPAPPPAGYVPPPPGGYAQAGVGVVGPRTDGLAIGALITGILAVVCFWICLGLILGPAAAIMGFISRQRIAASGGTVAGGGLALAGMILGIVGFVLTCIEVIWWVFVVAHSASTPSGP